MSQFTDDTLKQMKAALDEYPSKASAILPVLQLAQKEKGWISPETIRFASELVGVPESRVRECVTFYTMFNQQPVGKYEINVCTNISCALVGGEQIYDHFCSRLGVKNNETTKDGLFTVRHVECLASCGTGPMALVNDEYIENLTPEKCDQLIENWRRKG